MKRQERRGKRGSLAEQAAQVGSTRTSAPAAKHSAEAGPTDREQLLRAMTALGSAVENLVRVAREGTPIVEEALQRNVWTHRHEADLKRVVAQRVQEFSRLLDVEPGIPEAIRTVWDGLARQLASELRRWTPPSPVPQPIRRSSLESRSAALAVEWASAQNDLEHGLAGTPDVSPFACSAGYPPGGSVHASALGALVDLARQLAGVAGGHLRADLAAVLAIAKRTGDAEGIKRLRVDVERACAAEDELRDLRSHPVLSTKGRPRSDVKRALEHLLGGTDPRSAWTNPDCGRAKDVATAFVALKLAAREGGRLRMLSHSKPIVQRFLTEPDGE